VAQVLYEEQQRVHIRWWITAPAIAFLVFSLACGAYRDLGCLLNLACMVTWIFPRRLIIRLTSEGLHVRGQAVNTSYTMDQIVRCEAVDYKHSFWRGVEGPGMEFPSSVVRVSGNRGIRLDLTDGLHLLIGSRQPEQLVDLIRRLKAQPLVKAS
jgi:hypothetical protein